jgi:hypothetical protein
VNPYKLVTVVAVDPGGVARTGAQVSVTLDDRALEIAARELAGVSNGFNRAIVGAINKSVPKGRTIVIEGLMEKLAVKKRITVAGRVRAVKASLAAGAEAAVGYIKVAARAISLTSFQHRDTRDKKHNAGQGVFVRQFKDQPETQYPRAFKATGEGGAKQIFERVPGAKRYPLVARKGVSLLDVYRGQPQLRQEATAKIGQELRKDLFSQIDRLLKRRKSDRPQDMVEE